VEINPPIPPLAKGGWRILLKGIREDFAKGGKWRLPKTLMSIQGIKEDLRI
jgi:hypothetical protein